jgi:hypothetical protein
MSPDPLPDNFRVADNSEVAKTTQGKRVSQASRLLRLLCHSAAVLKLYRRCWRVPERFYSPNPAHQELPRRMGAVLPAEAAASAPTPTAASAPAAASASVSPITVIAALVVLALRRTVLPVLSLRVQIL